MGNEEASYERRGIFLNGGDGVFGRSIRVLRDIVSVTVSKKER